MGGAGLWPCQGTSLLEVDRIYLVSLATASANLRFHSMRRDAYGVMEVTAVPDMSVRVNVMSIHRPSARLQHRDPLLAPLLATASAASAAASAASAASASYSA